MRFLTLIFGSIGSGKTAELLKVIDAIKKYNDHCVRGVEKSFTVFKPALETRDNKSTITSRNNQSYNGVITVSNVSELAIEIYKRNPDVIIIDECQFFEFGDGNNALDFILLIYELLENKKEVILSGLIQDCYGNSFEILGTLCCFADEIINPHVNCKCGVMASRTQRLQNGFPTPITDPIIIIDNDDNHNLGYSYEPRCNNCWEVPEIPHPDLVIFRNTLDKLKT